MSESEFKTLCLFGWSCKIVAYFLILIALCHFLGIIPTIVLAIGICYFNTNWHITRR